MAKKKEFNSNTLAQMRTLLANQRTHLAYIRTGFAVTALAVKTKSNIVILIGMFLIAVGLYQYYTLATIIENEEMVFPNREIPVVFTIAGILAVYYYWSK
jgi:uncharacterized membrane protein YidH (DUF202 family)